MLVLLGVPWIFSAFGVIDTAGSNSLEMLQGIFNVSNCHEVSACCYTNNYKTRMGQLYIMRIQLQYAAELLQTFVHLYSFDF